MQTRRWCAAALALLAVACREEPAGPAADVDPAPRPLVIAHRGASGERPEHTLEAYRLAIEQGADFVEVDLVATRDGHLVCRHENELSGTTDIATRPDFAARRTTKRIDGYEVTGWFSEDLSLAELRTLRAVERIPRVRPANAAYDGRFGVPTLQEVLALLREEEAHSGRRVGLYPELKHPTWFAREGRRQDGSPIGISLGRRLVDDLVAAGFTDPDRVFVQSFEIGALLELQREILPGAGIDLPLVQLLGTLGDGRPFDMPYDARLGGGRVDPQLAGCLGVEADAGLAYADLVTPAGLACLARLYAEGIGPYKDTVFPRERSAEGAWRRTGDVASWVADARAVGLHVHPYTLRLEAPFQSLSADGRPLSHAAEIHSLLALGADGFFTDHAGAGVAARDAFVEASSSARR